MSSAGWGIFVGEVKRFREKGGDIKLVNMNLGKLNTQNNISQKKKLGNGRDYMKNMVQLVKYQISVVVILKLLKNTYVI